MAAAWRFVRWRAGISAAAPADYTDAVFLNFEFKGLGGAGTSGAGTALRGISGYEDPF